MHLDIAVAKVRKYAVPESGDTIETIERPGGGISIVVVDGQRSGKSAKAISNMVARKAVSLLAEGVRDGAVARAAHDYLYTQRAGKVSATLNIASVDLESHTLVLSRNSHCPIIVAQDGEARLLDEPSNPVGVHKGTKPVIAEIPLAPATIVVIYTDGLIAAGERTGRSLDVLQAMRELIPHHLTARQIARDLLDRALTLDEHRPADDISLVVLTISKFDQRNDVRWLNVSMPI
ncbi:MAG: serine/threonine-protein phosphatase [Thermoflexales bacterium]|nr:serine/threonine-protein phosphatase [Thermoflexales bacterium]